MGRGVLREEPAIHFSGRHQLVGSAVSDLEGTVAGSRALRVVAGRA
jgi:hypothetical protein